MSDNTCYIGRSEVRQLIMSKAPEGVARTLLAEINNLTISTAADFRSAAPAMRTRGNPATEIGEIWQELLDKDDRTPPAEYPEMVLITHDELAQIIEDQHMRAPAADDWKRLDRAFWAAHDFISKQSSVDYDGDFPQPNAAFDLCNRLNEAMPSLYAFKPRCGDCLARYANGGCGDCDEGQS